MLSAITTSNHPFFAQTHSGALTHYGTALQVIALKHILRALKHNKPIGG
jgi:hypothetical protein